jgi:lysophospholipase L1-like esterase
VSVLIFLGVLALPEAAVRMAHRLRHGAWPVSLAAVSKRSQTEVESLFDEHSILPFVLRPGSRMRFMDTFAEINSRGYRGPELGARPSLRVLVVGGSTVFDTGVTDNSKTWCQRLQDVLSTQIPGMEIVNSGLPVYMLWTNYLKYVLYDRYLEPDVVLIYQGANDTLPWWPAAQEGLLRRDYWLFRGVEARSWSGIQGERKVHQQPYVANLLAHSVFLRGAYNDRGQNENVFANMTRARTVDETMPDAYLRNNLDVLGYFFDAIRHDGALPVLVPQTLGRGNRERLSSSKLELWVPGLAKLNGAYIRQAREAGVPVVDVTNAAGTWGDEYFADVAHFNDRGAEALAALLAARLLEHGDLQRRRASGPLVDGVGPPTSAPPR